MLKKYSEEELRELHPGCLINPERIYYCECGRARDPELDKGYFYIGKSDKRGGIITIWKSLNTGTVRENVYNQDTDKPAYKIGRSTDLAKRLSHYRANPMTSDFEFLYTWKIKNHRIFEDILKSDIKSCVEDDERGRHTFLNYYKDMNWFFKYGDTKSAGRGMSEWFQATDERLEEFAMDIDFKIHYSFYAEHAQVYFGKNFKPKYRLPGTSSYFEHVKEEHPDYVNP